MMATKDNLSICCHSAETKPEVPFIGAVCVKRGNELLRNGKCLLGALLILLSVTGCARRTGPEARGPSLISYQDQQRKRVDVAAGGNAYDQISDRLSSLAQDVYVGNDAVMVSMVMNEGKPSKGLRIILKGSAIEGGLLGSPTKVLVKSLQDSGKNNVLMEEEMPLTGDSSSGLEATDSEFRYQSQVSISTILPALKGGQGEVSLYVFPLDSNGESSAVFKQKFRVLDAGGNIAE